MLAELTAEQTGQSVDTIVNDSDRDRWFTAQEAVDYGLADAVIPIGQFSRGFEGVDTNGQNANGAS